MNCFACTLAALVLILVPATGFAQEGWIGPEDLPSMPARVAPTPPPPGPAPPALPPPVRWRMRSPKMMVSGIVLATLGTAGLVGSIAKIEYDRAQCNVSPDGFGCAIATGLGDVGWGFFAVFSGTIFATGTVLTIVGATPGRVSPWEPRVSVGPGSARLAWSF